MWPFASFAIAAFMPSPCPMDEGWLGSRVVSMLDSGAEGPGFKSQRDAVG